MKINLTEAMLAIFILLISIFTFKPAYDYTIVRLLIADIFVFLCALYFFGRRRPFSAPLPVLISLTGFVLFVTISIAYSVFPPATLRELPHFLTYLLLFLVVSQIYPTPFIVGSWIVAVVILSFTGLRDHNQIQIIVTPLGNKNFFAGYLILVIPITIAALWQKILALKFVIAKRNIPRQSNNDLSLALIIALVLVVILFLTLLVLADSQAAYAGLAVGLLFLSFISFGKFVMPRLKSCFRLLILLILIIALALTAFIGVKKGTPYILKNVRYPLWKGSADMVIQKPMTGFGPGAFLAVFQRFRPANYYNRAEVAPLSDHSHNEYLELASESGLPALLFFLTFLTSILALSIRKMKNGSIIASPPLFLPLGGHAHRSFSEGGGSKVEGSRTGVVGRGRTGVSPVYLSVSISSEWFLLAGLISGLIAILIDGLFSTNLRTFSVVSIFYLLLGFCAAIITTEGLKTPPISGLRSRPQSSFIWIAIMVFSVFSAGLIVREIKGQVYYKEGIAARNAQNWPDAISKYQKALDIDPANLQAAYKLGFVYANANQTEDAINLYREILRISPNFAKTYYNLALLSLGLNDKDSAVSYLNLGLRYDPYDTEAQKILNILTNPAAKPHVPQNQPAQ